MSLLKYGIEAFIKNVPKIVVSITINKGRINEARSLFTKCEYTPSTLLCAINIIEANISYDSVCIEYSDGSSSIKNWSEVF